MSSQHHNLPFWRYDDDGNATPLEIPVVVVTMRSLRCPRVHVEYDHRNAWDPAANDWTPMTEDEQVDAATIVGEFRRKQQYRVDGESERCRSTL